MPRIVLQVFWIDEYNENLSLVGEAFLPTLESLKPCKTLCLQLPLHCWGRRAPSPALPLEELQTRLAGLLEKKEEMAVWRKGWKHEDVQRRREESENINKHPVVFCGETLMHLVSRAEALGISLHESFRRAEAPHGAQRGVVSIPSFLQAVRFLDPYMSRLREEVLVEYAKEHAVEMERGGGVVWIDYLALLRRFMPPAGETEGGQRLPHLVMLRNVLDERLQKTLGRQGLCLSDFVSLYDTNADDLLPLEHLAAALSDLKVPSDIRTLLLLSQLTLGKPLDERRGEGETQGESRLVCLEDVEEALGFGGGRDARAGPRPSVLAGGKGGVEVGGRVQRSYRWAERAFTCLAARVVERYQRGPIGLLMELEGHPSFRKERVRDGGAGKYPTRLCYRDVVRLLLLVHGNLTDEQSEVLWGTLGPTFLYPEELNQKTVEVLPRPLKEIPTIRTCRLVQALSMPPRLFVSHVGEEVSSEKEAEEEERIRSEWEDAKLQSLEGFAFGGFNERERERERGKNRERQKGLKSVEEIGRQMEEEDREKNSQALSLSLHRETAHRLKRGSVETQNPALVRVSPVAAEPLSDSSRRAKGEWRRGEDENKEQRVPPVDSNSVKEFRQRAIGMYGSLVKAFEMMNLDSNDHLELVELEIALWCLDLAGKEARDLFKELDKDGNGRISLEELFGSPPENLRKRKRRAGAVVRFRQAAVRRWGSLDTAFRALDTNFDGVLSRSEMKVAIDRLGLWSEGAEAEAIFEELDLDEQGKITLADLLGGTPQASSTSGADSDSQDTDSSNFDGNSKSRNRQSVMLDAGPEGRDKSAPIAATGGNAGRIAQRKLADRFRKRAIRMYGSLVKAFEVMDLNENKKIELLEFEIALIRWGFERGRQARALFEEIDEDNSGTISLSELLGCPAEILRNKKSGAVKKFREKAVRKWGSLATVAKRIDLDRDGVFDRAEVRVALVRLGLDDEVDADELFEELDLGGRDKVSPLDLLGWDPESSSKPPEESSKVEQQPAKSQSDPAPPRSPPPAYTSTEAHSPAKTGSFRGPSSFTCPLCASGLVPEEGVLCPDCSRRGEGGKENENRQRRGTWGNTREGGVWTTDILLASGKNRNVSWQHRIVAEFPRPVPVGEMEYFLDVDAVWLPPPSAYHGGSDAEGELPAQVRIVEVEDREGVIDWRAASGVRVSGGGVGPLQIERGLHKRYGYVCTSVVGGKQKSEAVDEAHRSGHAAPVLLLGGLEVGKTKFVFINKKGRAKWRPDRYCISRACDLITLRRNGVISETIEKTELLRHCLDGSEERASAQRTLTDLHIARDRAALMKLRFRQTRQRPCERGHPVLVDLSGGGVREDGRGRDFAFVRTVTREDIGRMIRESPEEQQERVRANGDPNSPRLRDPAVYSSLFCRSSKKGPGLPLLPEEVSDLDRRLAFGRSNDGNGPPVSNMNGKKEGGE
uniref:EF-hand domain-containing protein n=1 Tax=Chromera velia CCMP2878 TaxID=1169474 RepID=A0A0G4FHZ5_9ALVE|eukprot:Cvel_17048.t1-p1 / transcript=Cvel_17048.t1 / gene=Cvel_17048 / organism=Chromera_velia_CCMP2878 / gene_product=hypothetical protein / transcript_product=hypothetical protein / location=Cvel_scaffold1342:22904-31730(-) / protein_length=1445 / sequence_SO=supercontig / SO=protein_coding / is_pseudo=false